VQDYRRLQTAALDEVQCIVSRVLSGQPVRVFLCGSHARGTAQRFSDIDVAVLPLAPLPAGLLSELREALEESAVPYEVDVIDLGEAAPALREKMIAEAVAWNV
jgi:uncharacterized protein